MSTFRAHISVVAIAAMLALLAFAAPAGAGVLPGSNSSSVVPGDSLGELTDPLNPITPGDDSLGDRLGNSLGNSLGNVPPPAAPPKSDAAPAADTNGATNSAPKSSAPRTKRVSRPTPRTSTNSSRSDRKPTNGPAGPLGAKRVADKKTSLKKNATRRPAPKSPLVGSGPPAPNSFVGSVVDRIPEQYRWPVFVLACLAMLFAFTSLRERRHSLRVERAALVDSLTGLPNRPAFERRLAKEWRRSERYDRPLGMLLIDLDDFKHVNDTQGHAAGDAVLREVAAAISGRIRVSDMAARLGGDEFVVICPETPLEGLKILARSLEERLQEAAINISVGFTEREPADADPKHFVERADAAMYRRKESTRKHKERRAGALVVPQPLMGAAAD